VAEFTDDRGTSMALCTDSLFPDATAGMYASRVSFVDSKLLDVGSPFDNELCSAAYVLHQQRRMSFC